MEVKKKPFSGVVRYVWRREFLLQLSIFALSLLFSSFKSGGTAPLGVAAIAACVLSGQAPVYCIAGALAGSLLGGNWAQLCSVIIWCGSYAVRRIQRGGIVGRTDQIVILLISCAVVIPVFYIGNIVSGMLNLAFSVVAFIIMQQAINGISAAVRGRMLSEAQQMCVCLFMGICVLSLGDIRLWGVSPGAVLAAAVALYAVQIKGVVAVAAVVALGAGRVLAGADMLFIGNIAACALGASALKGLSKWGAAFGFFAVSFVIGTYVVSPYTFSLIETGAAVLLFLAMPGRVFLKLSAFVRSGRENLLDRELEQLKRKLQNTSDVLERVAALYSMETVTGGRDGVRFVRNQLLSVCGVLRGAAGDNAASRRYYDVETGAAGCPKEGSEQTGDCMGMRSVEGKTLLMLSDGMGSGGNAHMESAAAVALLGDLLYVGFNLGEALECVNRLLIDKGGSDMYATLDAMLMDLSDGSANFIKYAAPPSYIIRDDKMHILAGDTLPVGILTEARPAVHRISLKRGDCVILMTDGVCDSLEDELEDVLMDASLSGDATGAAEMILSAAMERSRDDDMSVIVAKIR